MEGCRPRPETNGSEGAWITLCILRTGIVKKILPGSLGAS